MPNRSVFNVKNLFKNKVVILFIVLCVFGIATSNRPIESIFAEVFSRFGRNSFMVLALIIPVVAGLGLNFGIVVGAIAAQIAVFIAVYFNIQGLFGMLVCVIISTPLAIFFGFLVGKLFNKTKGTEMITGLVLGYFADGLYQLLFLFIIGGVIPMGNSPLIIPGGIGVKNTIDLTGILKYTIDDVSMIQITRVGAILFLLIVVIAFIVSMIRKQENDFKTTAVKIVLTLIVFGLTFIPVVETYMSANRLVLLDAITIGCVVAVMIAVFRVVYRKFVAKEEDLQLKRNIAVLVVAGIVYALTYVDAIFKITLAVNIPVFTYLLILVLYVFNKWFFTTKLGQDMRSVGQSRVVANSAGLNVDKIRIIAMCMSTVFACWAQLIYLQNLGTFATYGAHTNVGLYAIAALLVGGASVQKAESKHAILGVLLFHTLFVIAPLSATNLFGSSLIGEYFRVFICYGVIAVSLAMHAWKYVVKKKS